MSHKQRRSLRRRELSQVWVSLVISGDDLSVEEITDTIGLSPTGWGFRSDPLGPRCTSWECGIGDTYPFPFVDTDLASGGDVPYPTVMMCLSRMQSQIQDRTSMIRDYCASRGISVMLVVVVLSEGQRCPVLDLSVDFLRFAAELGAGLSYSLELNASFYCDPSGAAMGDQEVREWTRKLLTAQSEEEDADARDHLRSKVVRQGSVYQSAECFVEECLAVIDRGDVTDLGVGDALDIVIEIVKGESDPAEIAWGNMGVVDRCRSIVRGRMSLLLRLVESNDEFVVFDAVELLSAVSEDRTQVVSVAKKAAGRTLQQRSVGIHENFVLLLKEILQN